MKIIKEGILLIYALMIIVCCSLVYKNNHEFYNKIKVVDDRQEIEQKSDMSIPVKIEVYNEKLGSYNVSEEITMKDILDFIKEITYAKDASTNAEYDEKQGEVKGTIYYLNGNKNEFKLSNSLAINGKVYNYNSSVISTLRNSLISYLYTSNNISDMVARSKTVEIFDSKKKVILNDVQKSKLKEKISKSSNALDNNRLISLKNKGSLLFHVNIYFNDKISGKVNSSDMAIIDVFNDYYVFQYLGDENGRQIYFAGALNKLAFLEEQND